MEICQDPNVLTATFIILGIVKIIFIVAPLVLIILISRDFFLNFASLNDVDLKKATFSTIRRLIACICLFFAPTIVSYFNSFLISMDLNPGFSDCITNSNLEYISARRIEIADEYLLLAWKKIDDPSVAKAEKAVNEISDEAEKEKRLEQIDSIKKQIVEKKKSENGDIVHIEPNEENTKDRLKFYESLSVLHSGQLPRDNTVDLYEDAGKAKFYAAECDLRLSGSTLYCAHERGPSTATRFDEYIKICKKYGMKAVLDLKWPSNPSWTGYNFYTMIETLANYIKDNDLEKTVIVQTSNLTAMNKINAIVDDVRYWYLVADYQGTATYNSLVSNMSTLKEAGVDTVNITRALADQSRINTIKNNGLKLCVYTVDDDASKQKFSNAGAEYIMVNNIP